MSEQDMPEGTRPHGSVFGEDNIVRGEVLVTLTPQAAASRTRSVPLHPGPAEGSHVDTLGVEALDDVLTGLGARDIVQLGPDTGVPGALALDGAPAPEDTSLARTFRVRVDADPSEALERLGALDEVEVAEPNRWREATATPNDPSFGSQWGLSAINAPAAWDITTGSAAVIVAVIDTGVDLGHPELAPLLVAGSDQVDLAGALPRQGWRFEGDIQTRDGSPDDEVGHGTHVAGTIAAVSDNGSGVAGVGWSTRLMPVRVLAAMVNVSDPSAPVGRITGVGTAADIAAGIRWAVDHGADVLNLSLGGDTATSVEAAAVAYAQSRDVLVVAAMGNDGNAVPSYPAAFAGVVAVGSVGRSGTRSTFSQTGPHIDLVAPGEDILSTWPRMRLATSTGTSMATPHVSGVAALVRAVSPGLSATRVADVLRSTARPLRDSPSDTVPNVRYGHGLLDASAAVRQVWVPIVTTRLRSLLITDCPPVGRLRTPVLPCPSPGLRTFPPGCPVDTSPVLCNVEAPTVIDITTPMLTTAVQTPLGTAVRDGGVPAADDPFGLVAGYRAAYAAGHAAALEEARAADPAYDGELFENR